MYILLFLQFYTTGREAYVVAWTRWEFWEEVQVGVKVPKVTWYQTSKKNILKIELWTEYETPKNPEVLEVALEWLS